MALPFDAARYDDEPPWSGGATKLNLIDGTTVLETIRSPPQEADRAVDSESTGGYGIQSNFRL